MTISTFEGIVVNGQIQLHDNVALPDKTRVYVVIPEFEAAPPKARVYSPRLVHPELVNDFTKQVIGESTNAGL